MANDTQIYIGARALNNIDSFYGHQVKSGVVSQKEYDAIKKVLSRKDDTNGLLVTISPIKEIRAKEYMSRNVQDTEKVSKNASLPEISAGDLKLLKVLRALKAAGEL